MLKKIDGLLYHVKSPSLFQLAIPGEPTTVQIAYLGPTLQWGVRMQRQGQHEIARGCMARSEAFGIVAKGFGVHAQDSVPSA